MARAKLTRLTAGELFLALSSDERIRILKSYIPTGDGPVELSAKGLSVLLKLPLSNVAYHCKVLRAAGMLTVTRYEPRRGAREAFLAITPVGARALDLIAHADDLLAV